MHVHPRSRRVHERRLATTGAAGLAVALPFLVPAIFIAVRRPAVRWFGDPALTELAVREAARFHQLVGIGSRFGWRHPGPLWLQLLVPAYTLLGHAPSALSVGALALHMACAVVAVVAVGRTAGPRAGAALAAAVSVYLLATGLAYWTNPWAGYAFTWPLLAVLALSAVGAAHRDATWGIPAALVFGSLLVQTDLGTVVVVVMVIAAAVGLRVHRYGLATGRWGVGLIALAASTWIPPLIQQSTAHPGNVTLIWRWGIGAMGGHPLRGAAGSVGAALAVVPLGAGRVVRILVSPGFGRGPWWAVLWTAGFVALTAAVAIVAHRRGRRFAADLAVLTVVAALAAVVAMSRVAGPIEFYLLTWVTILPVGVVTAAVLALAPETDATRRAALGVAATLAAILVVTQGTTNSWNQPASAEVAAITAKVRAEVGPAGRGLVRVHIVTVDTWPVAAGVALQLERAGAALEVDPGWVFLFGDAFRADADGRTPNTPPTAEVWFARPHERPLLTDEAGAVDLGMVDGVEVFTRVTGR